MIGARVFRYPTWLLAAIAMVVVPAADARETQLKGEVHAGANVNPNRRGTSQPVKVQIFFLAEDDAFMQASFSDLIDPATTVLGAELIRRTERLVGPGEVLPLEETLDETARYIGVVAAFTDIGTASWRAVYALPTKWNDLRRLANGNQLEIRVDGTSVTCAIVKE